MIFQHYVVISDVPNVSLCLAAAKHVVANQLFGNPENLEKSEMGIKSG